MPLGTTVIRSRIDLKMPHQLPPGEFGDRDHAGHLAGQPRHQPMVPGGKRPAVILRRIDKAGIMDRDDLPPHREGAGAAWRPEDLPSHQARQTALLPQVSPDAARLARRNDQLGARAEPAGNLAGMPLDPGQTLQRESSVDCHSHRSNSLHRLHVVDSFRA